MTLAEALARLHAEPHVWCLAGNTSLLTWDVASASLDDLPLASDARQGNAPDTHGWQRFPGGWLVQIDYSGAIDVVRVRSGLVWDAAGTCHAMGDVRLPTHALPAVTPRLAAPLQPAWDQAGHRTCVAHLRERIAAGDCYQVNLTLPFVGELIAGDDLDVFAALLAASPAPFAGCIRRPQRPTVISHSPECFVACAAGDIASTPIKGTRPHGRRAELLASAKDAAELTMIVDLVRNDLGRVAVPGSVRVSDPARVIDLTYVHHRAAEITARLRPGTRWNDILAAAFPAGSITGAPKRKAMELIATTEAAERSAYCGSFGWIGDDGSGQLNVAIRTAMLSGTRIALHAGGGITADSDGDHEWDEVRAKASAFASVLGGHV